ncbi:MAG: GDP-L-fucose synthase [Chloroflexi bacterium AL-W]|nr:GDP-L-fucose synthase [Chloroflexi bacterium AL-N1]NOK67162.1 GDP-L-fucose synthase [Chloroflexi bacterium AL-N10]NOK75344.1 GDP-L-fucose synthase [Chloroflexi bacterium AL-N5]NOK82132.1 GDP-L-fucose synthase [Chloroflexi bacterium AL-W]NOK89977.1 GDP-L-fucose synthase [Chloroflexi bacterium AL-N15]
MNIFAAAANAIVLAAAYYHNPEPMNIAGGTEISIRDLAAMIVKMIGYTGEIHWDTSKPNGQPRRKVDSSKAEKELGFTASMKFEDGLKETIAWYERNYDRIALQ